MTILAAIVVMLAVAVFPTVRSYLQQRGQINALRSQSAQQQQAVADARRRLGLWKDKAYVEQQARERLKFVLPGEKSYIVVNAPPVSARTRAAGGIASVSSKVRGSYPWYGQVWASIKAADLVGTGSGTTRPAAGSKAGAGSKPAAKPAR